MTTPQKKWFNMTFSRRKNDVIGYTAEIVAADHAEAWAIARSMENETFYWSRLASGRLT